MKHYGIRGRQRVLAFGAVFAFVVASQAMVVTSASANGTKYKNCASSLSVTGKSSQSLGGQTAAPTNPDPDLGCGSAKVRTFYRTYFGSPTYYTGWSTASGIVTNNPGNTILGANHDCTYKAPAYTSGFPFST